MVGAVDEIGGARARKRHAHVERTVFAEGEAAFRLVELERRHAQIEHDAIGRGNKFVHAAELAFHQRQTAGKAPDQFLAASDGGGIAVDATEC